MRKFEGDRLFIGCFPTGLVYADRGREVGGDYKRLGYLNYATLKLDVEKDCPAALRERIEADAARMQQQKGQRFSIANNMSIVLGSELRCEHPHIDEARTEKGDCACGCRDYRACPDCEESVEVDT